MIYYIVYKTTNKINGRIYIGTHKTSDLQDDYLGSGTLLKHAINKYGKENFVKEILFIFDNPEEMFDAEAKIINKHFLKNENTYNLMEGGKGGWEYVNKIRDKQKVKENAINASKCVSNDVRQRVGKYLGSNFGGSNRLTESEIQRRLDLIKDVDLTKFGWVTKVSKILNISHTHVARFIKKYYKEKYYMR